jgi:hypothetical protein
MIFTNGTPLTDAIEDTKQLGLFVLVTPPRVTVTTVPPVGGAVPVVMLKTPLYESQIYPPLQVGVPGLVPAPAPAANVAVPVPEMEVGPIAPGEARLASVASVALLPGIGSE